MKLSKNGWGTTQMLLLSGGIFLALLIVVILLSQFYGSYNTMMTSNYYHNLERNMIYSAKSYSNDKQLYNIENYRIDSSVLINEGYLDSLDDPDGKNCIGYVLVSNNNYNAYILCNKYKTANY